MTQVRFLLFLSGKLPLPEVAFPPKVPVFLVGRFMPFKSAHWTFLIDVLIMQKEKCCKTCKKHDDFTWVCFNGDSEHCADFTEPDCVCEFWEDAENENL